MVNNKKSRLTTWLDRLLPERCLLCGMDCDIGGNTNGTGSRSTNFCIACQRELPVIQHPCPYCALPLPGADALACGDCLQQPPPYLRCVSALLYQPPASQLITHFKYRGQLPVVRALCPLLLDHIGPQPGVDVVLSVPLHWRRRWQRGFNQAEVIADEVGRALQLPVQTRWLQRQQPTIAQQSLTASARARNLRGVFTASPAVAARRIALVDDVVTTGSTAAEITRTLLRAGAASVEIWCLARTPRRH